MRSVETEGETIDEAIDKALRSLGVERERAEIEILEDATRGLFGFGGRPARIRATVRPPVGAVPGQSDVPRETLPGSPVATVSRTDAESGAVADRARLVLEQILERLGVQCSVAFRPSEEADSLSLTLAGDESGLIIGRRGETLDALEYLVNRITSRDGAGSHRIVLDIEGYRERRRTSLEEMARKMADKAKQTRRIVTLSPMSPRDRRIVHLTLQGADGVATRSQGTGYYRRVLVVPANAGRQSRGPER